jgi:hypothetical protein
MGFAHGSWKRYLRSAKLVPAKPENPVYQVASLLAFATIYAMIKCSSIFRSANCFCKIEQDEELGDVPVGVGYV